MVKQDASRGYRFCSRRNWDNLYSVVIKDGGDEIWCLTLMDTYKIAPVVKVTDLSNRDHGSGRG